MININNFRISRIMLYYDWQPTKKNIKLIKNADFMESKNLDSIIFNHILGIKMSCL
jgi:hypothetical protein